MRSINAIAFRKNFGNVIDQVVQTGEPVAITRRNRPLVVLVPADRYEAESGNRTRRLEAAAARVAEWRAAYAPAGAGLDPAALVRRDRDRP